MARQLSDVARPRRAEANWTWFTDCGKVAATRQRWPPSAVATSSRPQDGLAPWAAAQAIRAQACSGSVAVIDSGLPAPCHCTCHVAPAVLVCQISARPPGAAWPSSQPVAGAGKARSVNVGGTPAEIVAAAACAASGTCAAPAEGAEQSAAASAATAAAGAYREHRNMLRRRWWRAMRWKSCHAGPALGTGAHFWHHVKR